ILFALLILVLSLAVIYGSYYYWRLVRLSRLTAAERNAEIEEERPRKRCLDAFRGMTIVLMIFVNSGGGDYWWIKHSTWNGLHVADLVFPWFLWIMGVCIPISINAQMLRDRTFTKKAVLLSIFVRSVKLFLVGLCLNTAHGPHMEDIRIMGVLQRFGIAYFVVATMHVICIKPPNLYPIAILPNGRLKSALYDIYLLAFQWIAILCLTCVHLILVFGISVPGCPRGYLGPGGKQDDAKYMDCIGGATGYIDRLILGETHIYQHPTALYTYDAKPFDPEGLVGCLTTILQVFIGYQCGMTFLIYTNLKLMRLLIWSIALGMIGGILCSFSQDDGFIPINKNLWSLSFVFVTSSLAYLLFIIFYVVIDVYRYWSGTPFVYAGMNAIVMYVGHEVFHSMLPWHWHIGPMNTHFVLLLENMWNAAVWVVIAYVLHCKKIFIKI
ncbi:Heparan-alpha-glucosaminide N-acetyltransferase, partial [Pseudolycoriella hygida]